MIFPATLANNAAQSRGLKLALADMRWRPWLEMTALAKFKATFGRCPDDAEWVGLKTRMFDIAGPEMPLVRELERAA